jgi:hypothetical protein
MQSNVALLTASLRSGGLDTSIFSAISGKRARRMKAVSVAVADVVSPDEPFVKMIAKPLPAATSWGSYLITLCPRAKRQI